MNKIVLASTTKINIIHRRENHENRIQPQKEFYVAEYDKTLKKVVVRETNKDFDKLAIKHGFCKR